MASFMDRVIRAMRLDVQLYEEVEADQSATGQAMAVVVLSALAAGIGHLGRPFMSGPLAMIVISLVGWVIWASLTWLIGTKLLPEPETKANVGELLRALGFASAPGLIRVLGIIPILRWIVVPVVVVWSIAAMVIAVRQALDYKSTWRAIAVVLIGAFVYGFVLRLVMVPGMHHGMS
ncbi:MAG: hypothetical protein A2Y95_05285 [Deltaproteobacteria bacterium RBG_13_65_10]|jgi:hypothetical protein|nr:MAG: hypothetical protein A2Y95_05285 [Deltaproteobacteria bacterium RBG_13_65_10]